MRYLKEVLFFFGFKINLLKGKVEVRLQSVCVYIYILMFFNGKRVAFLKKKKI